MRKRRIVITMGDPAGIGPEIIAKAFSHTKLRDSAHFAVLGNRRVMEETCERLGMEMPFTLTREQTPAFSATPLLIESDNLKEAPVRPGKWTVRSGRASLAYIIRAIHLCMEHHADAMVTAPVCKAALEKAGCKYHGHTELIADLTQTDKVVMMLVGGGLRVALVTIHSALAMVPQLATRGEVLGTIIVAHRELRRKFGIKNPRIGVLGLNPHAGEEGLFGQEEIIHIIPAIKKAAQRKIDVYGPLPADTAFHQMLQGKYDALIAMYHDQGLGPLKTVAFDSGVNITLGPPIVRTSVDHGTAFDIAGKGVAREYSLLAAVDCAIKIARVKSLG